MFKVYYLYVKNLKGKWVLHAKFQSEEDAEPTILTFKHDGIETKLVKKNIVEHVFREFLKFIVSFIGVIADVVAYGAYEIMKRL